jgi:hypothetical protein
VSLSAVRNIVNGLRDDDESIYTGRSSFASEYEASDEGMKVFFKEHGRSGSRGSTSSYLSPKKSQGSGVRPETQVRLLLFDSPVSISH